MSHDLVRAAMTADDRLDDLTRARIWNALEDRLAEPERRRARWPVLGVLALGAAAVVAWLVVRDAAPATWTVEADATLASPIGPHTRAALVGPARLELVGTPGPSTTVRLRAGTLYAEFAGGPGRALRVEAPGAVVDVIGTVFAIEVRDAETCVSVLHGRVRVNLALDLTTGGAYCTSTGARPIAPAVRDALERHELVLTAQAHPDKTRAETEHDRGRNNSPRHPDDPTSDVNAVTVAVRRVPPAATTPVDRVPPTVSMSATVDRVPPTVTVDRVPPTVTVDRVPPPVTVDRVPPPVTVDRVPPAATATVDRVPPTVTATADRVPPTPTVDRVLSPNAPNATTERAREVTDPPTPPPRPAQPATADELYDRAEAALGSRDPQAADRALAALISQHPASPLVEQALYERARIAHQARAWGTARQHLDRLLALPSARLAEPARYLACRIAVETRDAGAASCLVEYRRAYPRSPHDRDVLGLLVQLDVQHGGCRAAAPRIAELARAYPDSKLARAWRARCTEAR